MIVFVLGGCTFEESAAVHAMNQKRLSMAHPRVLLCSNYIHNTKRLVFGFEMSNFNNLALSIS